MKTNPPALILLTLISHRADNNLLPGQTDLHGLPPEAAGDYAGFIKKQLTEQLTRYGAVDLM